MAVDHDAPYRVGVAMFGHLDAARRHSSACLKTALCGACHAMGRGHGQPGRLLIGADASVLLALVDGLRDHPLPRTSVRCPLPPWRARSAVDPDSEAARLVAAAVLILAGEKLHDDRRDGDGLATRMVGHLLDGDVADAAVLLEARGMDVAGWRASLGTQYAAERNEQIGFDGLSEPTAAALGAIARAIAARCECRGLDELERFTAQLGRCVYLVDALVDLRRDVRRGAFNPVVRALGPLTPASVAWLRRVFEGRFATLERLFEALPLRRHGASLRGVAVSGLRQVGEVALSNLPAPTAVLSLAGIPI